MPYCPHCGALVAEDATTCRNCGASLRMQQPSPSQSPQSAQTAPIPSASQYPPAGSNTRNFAILGVASAILSLFAVPEIFGSAAIILGAYVWRKEQGNRGMRARQPQNPRVSQRSLQASNDTCPPRYCK